MGIIQLRRSARGGRRPGDQLTDVRVFATGSGAKRVAVGIRFGESLLARMRWIDGDKVTADFNEDLMEWTCARTNNNGEGNALSSGGKKSVSLTVRFTVRPQSLSSFGLETGSGYDCVVTSTTAEGVKFRIQ